MNASQLAMPAAAPPPGMRPNFINPPNHNAASVALIIVCLTLATFFYMIRIYSKVILPRKLTVEDGEYQPAALSVTPQLTSSPQELPPSHSYVDI
jgi:hypothetical protein